MLFLLIWHTHSIDVCVCFRAHLKDRFLNDLRKVRETYKGEELKQVHLGIVQQILHIHVKFCANWHWYRNWYLCACVCRCMCDVVAKHIHALNCWCCPRKSFILAIWISKHKKLPPPPIQNKNFNSGLTCSTHNIHIKS